MALGAASCVDIAGLDDCLVIQDDGAEFDPLSRKPSVTEKGGAGLFALSHLLARRDQVAAVYRSYEHWSPGSDGARVVNQLTLFAVSSATRGSTAPFPIRLRAPIEGLLLHRPWNIPHVFSIQWSHPVYILDLPEVHRQSRPSRILSIGNRLVQDVLSFLPGTSGLQLRVEDSELERDFYRKLALRLGNRIVLID